MPDDSIERRIYFFRVICEKEGHPVDPSVVFSHINSLSYTVSGRYHNIPGDRSLSMDISSYHFPIKVKMGTIRRSGLPLVEQSGTTTPLTLPPGAGLYEPAHFIIFENNIMGFELNYYGPRAATLNEYIPIKASTLADHFEVRALIRRDVLSALSRIGEIRLFDISVQRDMKEHLKRLDASLADAFEEMEKFTDAETLEIVLRPRPFAREGIRISFLNNVKKLIDWLSSPDVREGINKLRIKGIDRTTGGKVDFDLLEQLLISKKRMVMQDISHRAVDSDSAYGSIIEAYREARDEISALISGT